MSCLFLLSAGVRAELGVRPPFEPDPAQTALLQRTLTLLATSTPEKRNPVRVLVYGQSISQQSWWQQISRYLRETYPNADLTIENRAISGMQADALSSAMFADVIPFQPDLILFHAYGYEEGMERFLLHVRTHTVADVLLQGDHIYDANWREDPDDPAQIVSTNFWPYRNYVWMPRQAARFGACFAPIRREWRRYLLTNELRASSLLANVHLNDDGNQLLTELLSRFLAPRVFEEPLDPWNTPRVRTLPVDPGSGWHAGVLEVEFTGSQITVVYDGTPSAPLQVELDGKPPEQIPELYDFTRVSPTHARPWPAVLRVQWETPLIEEEWTLKPLDMTLRGDRFTFEVSGSITGPDGVGTNLNRFVSRSGRVVIEPRDHNLGLATAFGHQLPAPEYQATWRSVRRSVSRLTPPSLAPSPSETSEPIAIGLPDAPHRMRLIASDGIGGGIRSLRVFSPSGRAAIRSVPVAPPLRLSLSRRSETNEIRVSGVGMGSSPAVEFSPRLLPVPDWKPLPRAADSGDGTRIVLHPASDGTGFYRIRPQD